MKIKHLYETWFQEGTEDGNRQILRLLMEHGVDCNGMSGECTNLHYCFYRGTLNVYPGVKEGCSHATFKDYIEYFSRRMSDCEIDSRIKSLEDEMSELVRIKGERIDK